VFRSGRIGRIPKGLSISEATLIRCRGSNAEALFPGLCVPCSQAGSRLGLQGTRPAAAAVPDISRAVETSPPGSQMRTSNRSVSHPCSKRVTSRTAVYGPVRTVVWEGRASRLPLSRSIRSNIICMPSGKRGRGDHGPPRGSICRHGIDARQDFAAWPSVLTN
jgi:hypothetical protein